MSGVDLSSKIFGQKVSGLELRPSHDPAANANALVKISMPLGLSPAAMQKLAHPEGELGSSRAAAKLGIPMCLSSYATASLEDVKAQGDTNPYMMQMCVVRDRSIMTQLIQRARGGCQWKGPCQTPN